MLALESEKVLRIFSFSIVLMIVLFTSPVMGSSVKEFYVGVAMIYDANTPYDVERVGPAIDIAIDKVNRDILNSSYRVVKIERHYGSVCSNSRASGMVADLYYRHDIVALIGPACPYALDPVARLANYWNIPVITGLGDGGIFKNKTDYPTLTRLAYCQCRLRKVLGSVFEEFHWTDVAIVYDINDVHSDVLGSTLKVGLQKQNIFPYMFPYYGKDDPDFTAILQEVAMVTRVIVLVAPGESVRNFMLSAFDLGFISNGEFVFFDIHLFPFPGEYWGNHDWHRGDSRDTAARQAYEAMFRISLQVPTSMEWLNFTLDVKSRAQEAYNFSFYGEEVNFFIGAFHDAVLLYGIALNESLNNLSAVNDGYKFTRAMWDRTFQGVTGSVIIDDNGDRDTSYSILDLNPNTGEFHVIANFFGDRQWYNPISAKSVHWSGGRTDPPLNIPVCGFQGNNPECHRNDIPSTLIYIIAAISTILVVILSGTIVLFRHLKRERDLRNMAWMIRYEDINFHADGYSMSVGSLRSYITSAMSRRSSQFNTDLTGTQYLSGFATYMGSPVSVRMVRQKIDLSRTVIKELQQVRSMTHDNLTRLIGVGVEPNKVCIVHEFCSKGCIEDILENDNIKLDISFKMSILKDIVAGMSFIQSSCLKYHGHLTSKCCMVDSRFVVKISDYGLSTLYKNARLTHYGQELWVAPEHLRDGGHSVKGDVFSFAIIMVEVLSRSTPYDAYRTVMDVQEIVEQIKERDEPLFRPIIPKDRGPAELIDLLTRCWAEDPDDRPDFHSISRSLRKIMGTKHSNFVDMLLQRMEKYATNLEDIVEERTQQLLVEKKRSEELLHQILPRSVARDLLQGRNVLPESFSSVSIYFSDLVDFTSLCSKLTALQVIDVLNEVYTLFDNIIDKYNVYKVETIGDAYMVASGLPIRNGTRHVTEICRMALDLRDKISNHELKQNVVDKVKLRIGIHTGPCVTGVVGLKMPRYCLFGDTVNTASRMETTGVALKIHISDVTKTATDDTGLFKVECRGEINIKGKGSMTTYWLVEEVPTTTPSTLEH
ncbi:atrial natriuretic peptide receptor 1-like [Pecten maximus]|uniref:atrial natriuretic peptide receptor 1-like n=1 Tax=Pecten maximus TaxID=6579 RepID=UPI001458ADAA|nr:atrial natriuretic peptide receptor 1-like [Pecten maximus]